ncbi:MAG: hypothetical protein EOM50_25040, partial [Erysipelotrichia bacterium]|nr:hypothetical protein [Erysipelotrichia bacterium]
ADSLFDGSTNGLNSYLKPNESPNDTVTKVQLTFNDGGLQTVLTKEFREKWVKSRGTEEIVYDGTETKYYFNGSEMIKKDYLRKLYEIFGMKKAVARIEDETKLLSKVNLMNLFLNLEHFKTLDTKTLRELVILVVGDEDITNYDMSEGLKTILKSQRFDLETSKKQLKDNIKKAVKQGATGYDKILDVIEDVTFKEVQRLNVALRGTFSLKMDIFEKAEATKFISFLLGYFFDNGIEIKKEVMFMLEVEDRKRVMFMMLKHKRCAVCGASSELHHSPALGIGYEFDDGKQTGFLPLCRKHHAEAHSIGLDTFNSKYKLKPLWLNDNQIKELIRVYKN